MSRPPLAGFLKWRTGSPPETNPPPPAPSVRSEQNVGPPERAAAFARAEEGHGEGRALEAAPELVPPFLSFLFFFLGGGGGFFEVPFHGCRWETFFTLLLVVV